MIDTKSRPAKTYPPELLSSKRQSTGRKKSFWTKRRVIFFLWLLGLIGSLFIARGILLGKLNRQLSDAARRATGGRIQQVEISFSILRLYDFLRVGGRIAEALGHGGRPVIEELTLEGAELRFVPLNQQRWKLLVHLDRISSTVGNRQVFMTRTEIRGGTLVLAPNTAEEFRLDDFSLRVGPSSEQPEQFLQYTVKGRKESAEVEIRGRLGQERYGKWLVDGEAGFKQLPLSLLPLLLDARLKRFIVSGQLSAEGQFRYSGGRLEVEAKYSGSDLVFNPQGVKPAALRERLESVTERGEVKDRRFQLSAQIDDPRFEWEPALLGTLSDFD